MRSSDQYKSIEGLLKRLNGELLEVREGMGDKERGLRREVRNYLFNMLFYND